MIQLTKNEYEWHDIKRVVFMAEDGKGNIIVEKVGSHSAYLYNLNVVPESRKRGVATALIEAAERWCKEQGYESCTLEFCGYDSPYYILEWYYRRGYKIKSDGIITKLLEKRL